MLVTQFGMCRRGPVDGSGLDGEPMKKSVRLLVVPALAVATQVAFAAGPNGPQTPPPVPPITQPYPGPIGPNTGPVDPTPTEPPVGS